MLVYREHNFDLPSPQTTFMSYLTFLGSNALSDFRRKALIKRFHLQDVHARWVHFVAIHDIDRPQDFDQNDLHELLLYGDGYAENEDEEENTTTWFIQPRKGTISQWSSKATSIAHVCGFGEVVMRIERGTIVKIRAEGGFDEDGARKELCDPMTQDLSDGMPDLEVMFGEQYVLD